MVSRGRIDENREPRIFVTVIGNFGAELRVDFLVDTGHYGQLVLPTDAVSMLGLVPTGKFHEVILAGGGIEEWPIYRANVLWNEQVRNVEVLASDSPPLLGMAMLYEPDAGHADRLTIDAARLTVLIEHNPPL